MFVKVLSVCLQTKMHVGLGPAEAIDLPVYAVDFFSHRAGVGGELRL